MGRRGGSTTDVVVLSTKDDALTVEEIVSFEYPNLRPSALSQVLLDKAGRRILAVVGEGTADELQRMAVLTYDLLSGECSRWVVPRTAAAIDLVSDQSRPR